MELIEVEGYYRNGQVILDEPLQNVTEARVKVKVIPEEQDEKERKALEREAAVQRLFASMEKNGT